VLEFHYENEPFFHTYADIVWIAIKASLPIAFTVGLLYFILFNMHKLMSISSRKQKENINIVGENPVSPFPIEEDQEENETVHTKE